MRSVLFSILAVAPYVSAHPRSCRADSAASGKAIYFITNDAENAVVAVPIGNDGTLSGGTVTGTEGAGSAALGADGQPALPDALVSQSALSIAGQVRKLDQ